MKLAIGTAQFGLNYGISNKTGVVKNSEIKKILKTAQKADIEIVDTAQSYGNSEEKLGYANVKKFKTITKIRPNIEISNIEDSIKKSLDLLKFNKLYGILYHEYSDFIKNEKSFEILNNIKDKGFASKIGFSLYYTKDLEYLLKRNIKFDILQIPFNIFDQRFKPYFPILKNKNIEIHTRSAFLQGLVFLNPYKLSSHFKKYISLFSSFQNKIKSFNYSVQSVCLQYIYSQSEIDNIVLGICSNDELESNIRYILEPKINNETLIEFDSFKIDDENIILPFNWK